MYYKRELSTFFYDRLVKPHFIFNHLKISFLLLLLSCSKNEEPILSTGESITDITYTLRINSAKGGVVDFNNPNQGEFPADTEIQLNVTTHQDSLFVGWSNGLRDNPLNLLLQSNMELTPRFISKYDLLTRFEKMVIGNGENGPLYTLKWAEMNLFLEGNEIGEFNRLLNNFITELRVLINHDDAFSIQQVDRLSSSNVHIWVTEGANFKTQYSQFSNIDLDTYLGYAQWYNNNSGNIFEGIVFANSARMSDTETIEWTIQHELGHILGLKHTDERNSIMHPYFNRGVNNIFSDLDREALRFLHDERIPVFSDWESASQIIKAIVELPINDRRIVNQKKRTQNLTLLPTEAEIVTHCYRLRKKE